MMDLYIPYGFTPYEGSMNYGVFSTRQAAEAVLNERKAGHEYEEYGIYVTHLDNEESF